MRKTAAFVLVLILACPAFPSGKDKEKLQRIGAVNLDKDGEKWAEKTLKKMSLEQKVGQMFMVWCRVEFFNTASPDYLKLRDAITKYHVGGFGLSIPVDGPFLLKSEPYEAAAITNQLQRESDLPLIFAADFERGLDMRFRGTTGFPHAMAFGAAGSKDFAFAEGQITAQEARAIGVQWNFYPDADVNSNPANPIINTRAYGEDPRQVGELVTAYIVGAKSQGMLTTAKHFPGHGDTDTDTHLSFARVGGDRNRLDQVELAPFRDAIRAGVDSILIAHVTVPALEPDPNRVATTSKIVTSGLLRDQLGFKGLIVTDAMDMNGLMKLFLPDVGPAASGRAAVEVVKAGNDVLLIPADLDGAYNGLLKAVRSGEIPQSRIDESVLKILRAKVSVGLDKGRMVDLAALPSAISRPENLALAQKVADSAVTLVRDSGRLLPLRKSAGTSAPGLTYPSVQETQNRVLAVIFSDDMRLDSGRTFEKQLRLRVPDANIMYVDQRTAAAMTPAIVAAAAQANVVLAAIEVVPSAGRTARGKAASGSASMSEDMNALMGAILQRSADRTIMISMGNPYIASDFPQVQNYLCTYSNAPVSETSAVRALFGEIAIHGRLPVSIPNVASRGAGIDRSLALKGGYSHGSQHH